MQKKRRLLIVDDEPANLQKLRRTFVDAFIVSQASSGEEALDLLSRKCFDVIITDQRMPGISGVDLLKQSLESCPQAIRIILTGYTDVDDMMDAINQGQVHRYVTKPWEPFSFKRTVLQDIELVDLKRENQLLAEQLRIAREVHRQLFPQTLPDVPGLDYIGFCRSAREVGGDYYDFLPLTGNKLLIAVGDISGKGISAALLMANLQGLLRSRAPLHGDSIAGLVGDINRRLYQTTDLSKFATLFCAVFDADTRKLYYVNAGHCPPVLVRGRREKGSLEFLEATGTLVGMFPDTPYEQACVSLTPGDTLIVYTDGVTEAFNSQSEEFGERRLCVMADELAHLPPGDLGERILEEVRLHSGDSPQSDDLTLVLARADDG